MKAAREDWVDGQGDLDAEHLIFIDESGLSTKMARLRGWAPKGERCRAAIPHGHWKTVTFVGGLTLTGFVATAWLLDGPMDGECFLAWVEQMLAPTLRPGDIVVMDNILAVHKVAGVETAGHDRERHAASGRHVDHARCRSRPMRQGWYLRRRTSLIAALQSRLQSDRKCLRQAQGACAQNQPRAPSTHSNEPPPMPCHPTIAQTSSLTQDTAWI